MVQEVAGSNPVSHPSIFNGLQENLVASVALNCVWGDNRGDKTKILAPLRPPAGPGRARGPPEVVGAGEGKDTPTERPEPAIPSRANDSAPVANMPQA